MKNILLKDTGREIKRSLGRFFSIMVIVALGVAFLAGIKMSPSMMRDTTDSYMDKYHMMDLRIVSTLGLDEADLAVLKGMEGVLGACGAYSIDAITQIEDRQKVVKVHSLPFTTKSENDVDFMNAVSILEGRLPKAPNECVIDGNQLTRLPLHIGDTITLELEGEENSPESLFVLTYTVVGIVNSPYYMHFERGTTTIGSGNIDSFIYIPDENFKGELYTEIFLSLQGAKELDSYSEEYTQLVEGFIEKLEQVMEDRAMARYETLVIDGNNELEDGKKTFLEERTNAYAQLEETKLQLQNAEQEIKSKEQMIAEGEEEIKNGFTKVSQEISIAKQGLVQKQKDYELNIKQFKVHKAEKEKALNQIKEKIEASKAELETLEENIIALDEAMLTASEAEYMALFLQKAGLQAKYNTLSQTLQSDEETYNHSMVVLKQTEKGLEQTKEALVQTKIMLDHQAVALNQKKVEALASVQRGKEELAKGKVQLEEGKEQYARAKAEVEVKLKKAQQDLIDAKVQIDGLKIPKVFVLGRDTNYGFVNYKNAADTIERIGQVFPVFFFIVAALVCLTTMTRMVDEGRTVIGTFKALGYTHFAIMSKYILYAGIASVLGSIIGIIVGVNVFPRTIYNAYTMAFAVPPLQIKFYPVYAISAILMMTLLTVLAAVVTTLKVLGEQPSELMRPKAPSVGKRILLEHIPFIWNRLGFFQKVVARNIFRYKKKFFMTTIGIAGCTALLIAGLGLKQSVMSLVNRQYGEIFTYDLEVAVKNNQVQSVEVNSAVENFLKLTKENITVTSGENTKDAVLIISHDVEKIPEFINLRNRVGKAVVELGNDGIVLSEKLAKLLDVKLGDTIAFENSDLENYEVKVIGVTENYIGHYMYMSKAYSERIMNQVPAVNDIYVKLKDTSLALQEELSSILTKNEDVVAFTFTTVHAEHFNSVTGSLDTVVIILIVAAGLLAFVVLYNLTTINISERYREIATIKVLGFDDFKVSHYIYRENIVLTLIGIVFGFLLGKLLFLFIMTTAEMDELMYGRELYASSYVVAGILTFIFAMLVNILMYFKLRKIKMIESLKSVE